MSVWSSISSSLHDVIVAPAFLGHDALSHPSQLVWTWSDGARVAVLLLKDCSGS